MNRVITYLLFIILSFFSNVGLPAEKNPSKKIVLENIEINPENNKLEFICDFNKVVSYHCLQLTNPNRLVLDLKDVKLQTKIKQPSDDLKKILKGIRSSNHANQFLRIVLDLNSKLQYHISTKRRDKKFQIFLDLLEPNSHVKKNKTPDENKLQEVVLSPPSPPKLPEDIHSMVSPKITLNETTKSRDIVIVIDPGHGGKDPGATGQNGAVEKEVVLSIAKQLQQMLNEESGYRAVLTRSTDYYIPLRKRLAIARKNHADMFIAIHADAYIHGQATGASVYALSQRGATSEAARWLAEKENESELGGLSSELADKDAILRSVLIDLSQTHTIESSLQIGDTVLKHLGKFANLHHPRVEQAAFVVLKSPDIPSILVETGFLTNPTEEPKLVNPDYQRETAYAIKRGIKEYFEANPPGGSWFSQKKSSNEKIALKDNATLENLAKHYHRHSNKFSHIKS